MRIQMLPFATSIQYNNICYVAESCVLFDLLTKYNMLLWLKGGGEFMESAGGSASVGREDQAIIFCHMHMQAPATHARVDVIMM